MVSSAHFIEALLIVTSKRPFRKNFSSGFEGIVKKINLQFSLG